MAKSLQEQLLGAGIVTEEQLKKTKVGKKHPKKQPSPKVNKNKKARQQTRSKKKQKPVSDLAQFYQQRSALEKKEREEAERKKKEAARIKKLNAKKIRKLLLDNLQNDENAEIRYNFIVGTNIKYLYVTEQQQKALSNGELAITFLGGRRCLISIDIAEEIRKIDENKLIIIPAADSDDSQ